MSSIDGEIVDEIVSSGRTLHDTDRVALVERHHDDQAGVSMDLLAEYARALESRRDFTFDADRFVQTVTDRLTDADSWDRADVLYSLDDDRLSRYPSRWHDRLGGSRDVARYVEVLRDAAPELAADADHGGAGAGIPEETLLDVVTIVGRVDYGAARAALEDARGRGDVVEDADQHRHANVYLSGRADARDG